VKIIRFTKTARDHLAGTAAGQQVSRPPRPMNAKDRARRSRRPSEDAASLGLMRKVLLTESTRKDGSVTVELTHRETAALMDYLDGWEAAARDSGTPAEVGSVMALRRQIEDQ